MLEGWWYLSCSRFTVAVRVLANGRVVQGPPITRKFMGQQIKSLADWMRKQGDFRAVRLGA